MQESISTSTQAPLVVTRHHNQRLFSDYYLDTILPQQWDLLLDEARAVMVQLQELYARYTPNPNNEAQTEDDWIKPALQALGHVFEVQVPLKVARTVQEPDYVFYRNEAFRIANKGVVMTEAHLKQRAYAVGDAKKWDRPLDKIIKGSETNENPSYQIATYILHSGLPWGILTNGRLWRLYHQHTAHKLEVFYEVDLPAALTSGNASDAEPLKRFLYFYVFFRRAAFEGNTLTLEHILNDSTELAQSISEGLRHQVYDALRFVAQGFLAYRGNRLTPTPETCKALYDNSLILLYRLLFILYAEARNLLPMNSNVDYRRKASLHALKYEITTEDTLLPQARILWERLKYLFDTINRGNPPLNVTTFNGGLFDPVRHDFLERYAVDDRYLALAIDKLARVKSQFVDYRDLAERHLGTIYEGLLEYTLHVATEPMVELRSSSKIVPAQGVPKKDIATAFQTGEVYLVTDQGERKTTGSYYTPDYIVKYMVDETLRPLLEGATANAHTDAERIQAILALNVLDPAMGSGHFPVEATEYIARYLVERKLQPEESDEADLTYWKRRVAQQCIYGVDLNPLAVELAKLSLWLSTVAKDRPLNFLDHHLRTGNALIGSWLAEVAAGQHPRARHNQKQAKLAVQAAQEAGQLALSLLDDTFRQDTGYALASMRAIEHNPGITVQDVKAQEAAYEELRHQFSEKYLTLANLGASLYYTVNVGSDVWRPLAAYALGKEQDTPLATQYETWTQAAEQVATQKRFFHWELEFPDIFFDSDGQPLDEGRAGFDAVLGNPPYVRQEALGPDKPYFQEHFEVYHGKADLFVYFFAQGLRLLRTDGRLAYISSNSWLRADYATTLRQHLRTQTSVESIVDLGDNHVFADAPDLTPAIQVVRKTLPAAEHIAQAAVFARNEQIKSFRDQLANKLFVLSIYDQIDTGWQLTADASRNLFTKLMATGKPLEQIIDGRMYRGILTGLNEVFIIDQATRNHLTKDDPNCNNLIKPLVRGEDLRPWYQENEGRWLIWIQSGWTRQTFTDIALTEELAWQKFKALHLPLATYLEPFAEPARKRQNKGQFWWELNPCNYYSAFESVKLVWPDIVKFPRFSWDERGHFVNDKGCMLLPNDKALLGVLQSRVCWFCVSRLCAPLGERAGLMRYQQKVQYIERLPIPPFTDEQRAHIGSLAQQLTDVAQKRYAVRRKTAQRIQHDLGTAQAKLNQRLEVWWELSFPEFRAELAKVFKHDVPLKDRDDWEELLHERGAEIRDLTHEIIRLETLLNAAVYDAFDLTAAERTLIEQETKYSYGEW